MRKEVTAERHKADRPEKPAARLDQTGTTRARLRELDILDVELGDDYLNGLHDRIMARIEKTPMQPAEPERARIKANPLPLSLVDSTL